MAAGPAARARSAGYRAARAVVLGIVPALLAAYLVATPFVLLGDDAFITLAYARNLAEGHGLVFHPGERIWGYTSPLNTLWMAGLALLPGSLPLRAALSSALWLVAACALGFALLRRRLSRAASLFAGAILVTLPSLWVYHGMEGTMLVALQGAFLWLALERRSRSAAIVAALSCLARPDSLVLVGPILLARRDLRRPLPLALFAAPGALWCLFTAIYYGQVLPSSLGAKGGVTEFPEAFRALAAWATRPPWELLPATPFRVLLVLSLAALPFLWRPLRESGPLLYALTVYPWLLIGAYAWIGVPVGHYWEIHSATFFLSLGWLAGLGLAADRVLRSLGAGTTGARVRTAATMAFGALLALVVALGFGASLRLFDRQGTEAWTGGRHDAYREVARWVETPRNAVESLALGEVGTIGYYTDVRIVDTSGIVTPGLRDPATGARRDVAFFLRRDRPSHVLLAGDRGALDLGTVRYAPVVEFPARGFLPLTMLERIDSLDRGEPERPLQPEPETP